MKHSAKSKPVYNVSSVTFVRPLAGEVPVRGSLPPTNNCYAGCVVQFAFFGLFKEGKKKEMLNNCPTASFEELRTTAGDATTGAEASRFRRTPSFWKIFQQINRGAVAGDVITQYNTEYASIT